jgi:hypothetical protein
LAETIKGSSYEKVRYGITKVQPNRALKKCRIRNLLIEYLISGSAIVLTVPRSCSVCDRIDYCTDDFIIQIIDKLSQKPEESRTHYFLP